MEPIYAAASAIADRIQPNIDGGLLAFALHNVVWRPSTETTNRSTDIAHHTVTDHVFATFARTGYSLTIAFGIIFAVILALCAIFMCRNGKKRVHRSDRLVFLVDADKNGANSSARFLHVTSNSNSCQLFKQKREQMQSWWPCLAIQFSVFSLITVILGTGILLGFTASSQLHASLATAPSHEEAVGRLLNPVELRHTNPPRTYVFPRVLRSLAQVRAYLSQFVDRTLNHTTPSVDQLINATVEMQDRMTTEFNQLLFQKIGVSDAFELGDEMGTNVIFFIQHSTAVVEQDNSFRNQFDRFKIELRSWLRLIQNYSPSMDDPTCNGTCNQLRAIFLGNLTARPDSFMPAFAFAIALNFLTTTQNATAETIQQQLSQGRVLASKQLSETKKIMAERINIPQAIRNMTQGQWDLVGAQLVKPIAAIDHVASVLTRTVAPKVASVSALLLTISCIIWILLLLLAVGLAWLVVHHHCIPSALDSVDRRRVRSVASCGLGLLAVSTCLGIGLLLCGGYLYTEGCRYVDPNQSFASLVAQDKKRGTSASEMALFPLDARINAFVDEHWDMIKQLASEAGKPSNKPMPVPRIRNPVFAISHRCQEDVGLLDAMDAIQSFNMTSLNDPEISDRFVTIGREIMIDALRAIDVNEMFPKETEDQLAMSRRLDDFLVDFNQLRSELPTTYLCVHVPDEESGTYLPYAESALWSSWEAYYSTVLKPRLSPDQRAKLTQATELVRHRMINMTAVLGQIDSHLEELTKAKKISPMVDRLHSLLQKLKAVLSDKPALVEFANRLYNETVAVRVPKNAEELILRFGPLIMSQVGRCRRLYDASQDLYGALCDGVVGVLNGLWFVVWWVILTGSVGMRFALMFLLHKPPATAYRRLSRWGIHMTDARQTKINGLAKSTGGLGSQTELEHLNSADTCAVVVS